MNRTIGFLQHLHLGFIGGAVAFTDVAFIAGGDKIFPAVFATAAARQNVINGQVTLGTTILTRIGISFHHVIPRKHNAFIR
jgi:hypothetical protein